MKTKITFLLILFLAAVSMLRSQELSRRPLLGVMLHRVDEDTKRVMGLTEAGGVLVQSVIPNSTAEKAGFKQGDVLLEINAIKMTTPEEAVRYVASCDGGQSFTYALIRDKQLVKGSSVFAPMPEEKHEGIEMKYTSAQTVNGQQRLVVSKLPGTKKRPALVFIGGIGCYSLDFPLEKDRSEGLLLNKLTLDGYTCIRAEKPGMGDSRKCTPCAEVSFMDEVSGYVSAIREIKKYDYIDSNRVYIIGHSMGGVMAPLVAQQTQLRGIIAYGTIGSSFIEYLAKTRRTIAQAFEMTPEETDDLIKESCECAGYYFVDGLSTEQAAKKNPTCREYLSVFDYRSPAYNAELYKINIPGAWKGFKGDVLMLWGESDYVASKEDHEIIAATVNRYNKGKATFRTVKSASHGMHYAESFRAARNDDGHYNPEVGKKISEWLKGLG